MISKIAMIALVVFGLRWLAADAPVSQRTVAIDASKRTAETCDCDCPSRSTAARGTTPRGEPKPLVSAANQEHIRAVGSEVWTIARPLLVLAADKALEGLSSLLRSAADNIPHSPRSADSARAHASP